MQIKVLKVSFFLEHVSKVRTLKGSCWDPFLDLREGHFGTVLGPQEGSLFDTWFVLICSTFCVLKLSLQSCPGSFPQLLVAVGCRLLLLVAPCRRLLCFVVP